MNLKKSRDSSMAFFRPCEIKYCYSVTPLKGVTPLKRGV